MDTPVIGRNTFEKVLTFGRWPYGEKPVVVLTRVGGVKSIVYIIARDNTATHDK